MSTINTHDQTWATIEAWARRRITELHEANEQTGRTVDLTENTRGRIAALRELLALPELALADAKTSTAHPPEAFYNPAHDPY